MSDEKNDIDTGFEEKLAEIVDKKSRNRSNHNIYERFISRVQGDDDGDDSENEHSKPLDTDDDAFIFDFYDDTDTSSQAIDSSLTNASSTGLAETDGSADEGNDSQPDTLEPPTPSVIQAVPVQDRLASSKKPLIIGMVFGSLLIVMIVLALIYTGVLSTPMQTTAPDSTEIDSVSDSEKAAPDTAPAVTVNTPPSSNPVEPSVAKIQDTAVSENPEVSNTSKTAEALPAASSTDAAITYEDFREESQNTLYRETDD
ncbi:RodZ family helix-turn-helix domain-containing protein [Psychrobacter alimentarius]|uniref:hypothetical protein n=1 Tax=Psychrobacter alimentarius TaxID=261164 RepID=UPI0019196BA4|nr:hypothetical protein [Psychrobacter alimentarius]